MRRRDLTLQLIGFCFSAQLGSVAALTSGQRLAQAARAQIGVTRGYDPNYTRVAYPNGDVPRSIGVCADVILRAARDGLGLDLQKLVHEDMLKAFDTYPSRRTWGNRGPDANIDHRRVLNLETYFERVHARLWSATAPTPGDAFSKTLEIGDILTWRLLTGKGASLPHIGIVSATGPAQVVHNIGNGTEETPLAAFQPHRAAAHFRWPA